MRDGLRVVVVEQWEHPRVVRCRPRAAFARGEILEERVVGAVVAPALLSATPTGWGYKRF